MVRHHAVPLGLVHAARAEWPAATWPGWIKYDDEYATKLATRGRDGIPLACQMLLDRMACLDVSGFGPDAFPDLTLYGAGLHEIPTGGKLGLHLDAAVHPVTGWSRVASAVLFVDSFADTWGGELQLGSESERLITPTAGTVAIMATGGEAWHAVRQVTGPIARRTLAMFWWSAAQVDSNRKRAHFQ